MSAYLKGAKGATNADMIYACYTVLGFVIGVFLTCFVIGISSKSTSGDLIVTHEEDGVRLYLTLSEKGFENIKKDRIARLSIKHRLSEGGRRFD